MKITGSTRKDRLIALLKDYNPTIFGVQEGLLGQIKYIDNSFEKYSYIGVGRDDGQKKGSFVRYSITLTFMK